VLGTYSDCTGVQSLRRFEVLDSRGGLGTDKYGHPLDLAFLSIVATILTEVSTVNQTHQHQESYLDTPDAPLPAAINH
jgi:hypothetical protein